MKNIFFAVVVFSLLSACESGDGEKKRKRNTEEVMETYTNGIAKKVWIYKEIDGKRIPITQHEYYEDGNLMKTGALKNGVPEGDWITYYRSGIIWNKSEFQNGKLNDTIVAYYENGNVKYIGLFNEGVKTGKWQLFSEDGELESIQAYLQPGEVLSDSLSIPKKP